MVIKIVNQFDLNRGTKAGVDNKGNIHCKCVICKEDMVFIGWKRDDRGIKNIYVCPKCKKQEFVERHWK